MDVSNEQQGNGVLVYGKTPTGGVFEVVTASNKIGFFIRIQGGGPTPKSLAGHFTHHDAAKAAIRNYLIQACNEYKLKEERAKVKAENAKKPLAGKKVTK